MSKPNRISVGKHEGKVRLHLELPVEGEDSLVRMHDVDMPVVHALAVAGAIVTEAAGLLRFTAKPGQGGATEKTAEALRKRLGLAAPAPTDEDRPPGDALAGPNAAPEQLTAASAEQGPPIEDRCEAP